MCKVKMLILFSFLFLASFSTLATAQQSRVVNFGEFTDYVIRPDKETELFVREYGNRKGKVIVVLHGGWGAEHSYLISPLASLAKKWRLVFYDQRGSLRSRTPLESISVERHVEDLEYLRKSLGVDKITLVAHSMGGFLAASYLAKYPNRVRGLTLISPFPPKFDQTFWTATRQKTDELKAKDAEIVDALTQRNLLKTQNPDGFTEKQDLLRRKLFFSSAGGNIYHWQEHWETICLGFYNAEAGSKAAASMPDNPDLTEAIRHLSSPLTVICGNKDYIPLRFQQEWIKSVPTARLVVIQDAAHLIWIDSPLRFEKALNESMDKIDRFDRRK